MNVEGVSAVIAGAGPAELERRGWQALATSGAAATGFYTEVLDDGATMLLPGGMMLTDRESILRTSRDSRGRCTGWRACTRAR